MDRRKFIGTGALVFGLVATRPVAATSHVEISTFQDFQDIDPDSNNDYRLVDDINGDGNVLDQISGTEPFSNEIDGDGHTIENFELDTNEPSIFADVDGGTFKDLTIKDVTVETTERVALFETGFFNGTIENVTIENLDFTNDDTSGEVYGIARFVDPGSSITGLVMKNISLSSGMFCAGIARDFAEDVTIDGIEFDGQLEANTTGGLVMQCESGMSNVDVDVDITYIADGNQGGVIEELTAEGDVTFQNITFDSTIKPIDNETDSGFVGGFVGESQMAETATLSLVDIDGNIDLSANQQMGGLVGGTSGIDDTAELWVSDTMINGKMEIAGLDTSGGSIIGDGTNTPTIDLENVVSFVDIDTSSTNNNSATVGRTGLLIGNSSGAMVNIVDCAWKGTFTPNYIGEDAEPVTPVLGNRMDDGTINGLTVIIEPSHDGKEDEDETEFYSFAHVLGSMDLNNSYVDLKDGFDTASIVEWYDEESSADSITVSDVYWTDDNEPATLDSEHATGSMSRDEILDTMGEGWVEAEDGSVVRQQNEEYFTASGDDDNGDNGDDNDNEGDNGDTDSEDEEDTTNGGTTDDGFFGGETLGIPNMFIGVGSGVVAASGVGYYIYTQDGEVMYIN